MHTWALSHAFGTLPRHQGHGPALGNGVTLLYRRNAGNGTWVVKAPDGKGGYWTKRIAEADDYAEADSSVILTYFAAQDRAKALAGGGDSDAAASSDAPGERQIASVS
jgi:hypothetical protein